MRFFRTRPLLAAGCVLLSLLVTWRAAGTDRLSAAGGRLRSIVPEAAGSATGSHGSVAARRITPGSEASLQDIHKPLTLHPEQASSAAAFVDSVGVQTHINYLDTPYAQWSRVIVELKRLGVHHIRDALPLDATFVRNHQELAKAHIGCTCGFGLEPAPTVAQIVHGARAATDVEALEAPNECDAGNNCGGGGKKGIANVVALLPTIAQAGRTLRMPVIAPSFTTQQAYTSTGNISRLVNFNNLHVYFGGRHPGTRGWGAGDPGGHRYGSLPWWIDQAHLNTPGLPDQITETGYMAFEAPTQPGTIPESVEASYIPRTLLLAWKSGIPRTFLYELLDEFPKTGYGLLRHDFSEKPAFKAVANLLRLLQGGQIHSPGKLDLAIDGGDNTLTHVLFQKDDASYELLLWLEKTSYDAEKMKMIAVQPEHLTVQLDKSFTIAETVRFDDLGNVQRKLTHSGKAAIPLLVDQHLLALHITRTPTIRAPKAL